MRDLVDTTEMYLRTIYELEEEGITPLRARIAERLEQSGPTVSQTVSRMERDGLLHVAADRSLELTETGRDIATSVMRKHRLAEILLTDVLGLDIHHVHDEACRWEHVMSEEVERRVVAIVSDTSRSPFGTPVPALDQLGATTPPQTDTGVRAIDVPEGSPVPARVVQMNEILQVHSAQFAELVSAGVTIGSEVEIIVRSGAVTVRTPKGRDVLLADDLAHALRVTPLNEE
ncbi:metal-dependent regulator [Corynebacterium yudongzhengii]|uniref:Diphtheria toxin repressor n=1 Tax=Corynebacterium yudongzhengii TaxID=2080740 RepID=A0A2U1T4V8_9CORY|nr:metal-dependent transcriptional regulator [Corynebacterium yudongzhengii]AWB81766.1 metal-dependent regulator [Corynebacterium yudongzhengii]PWC01031.1 metal-dependent transcriptional regulator [Corynebacterium yudongzhengii]